jgi:rhamnose utilization protein RhaD (predicted bifunctional aldolase and dehydrogenase)
MNINKASSDLETISKYLGTRIEYAQGGGGNTSVKVDGRSMLIKASGFNLADVSTTSGFVHIDFLKYRNLLTSRISDCTEQEYTDFGLACLDAPTQFKPSIETCFHAILHNSHVIHSHSVFANILSCSVEGKDIARELFPEADFLPYATPGKNLAKHVIKLPLNTTQKCRTVFLQNHGVIIGGSSAAACIETHEYMNDVIKRKLNLPPGLDETYRTASQLPILFPDQAVYSNGNQETKSAAETLMAANYIYREISNSKLTPRFLEQTDVDYLANMESEKYRLKMALK